MFVSRIKGSTASSRLGLSWFPDDDDPFGGLSEIEEGARDDLLRLRAG